MTAIDGYLSAGHYQYCVTYEWTDNSGQIQKSTTSELKTVVCPTDGYSVTLTIPTLRVTSKTGFRDDVRVVIYRTEANQTTFHMITSVISPLYNDLSVDSITYKDVEADALIVASETLYTTGGVFDNEPPPACTVMTSYNNRVWLGGLADDPHLVWYSKTLQSGKPIEFSAFLSRKVDQLGGSISALARLDNALIIFTESAIYSLAGEGPNNAGGGIDYENPTLITTDVGCTNPNSIATTSQGLFFQSAKGIILLGRSGQIQYIGAPVEKFNDSRISSTTVIPEQNIIVFTTADTKALVYDYLVNQWSTFTGHEAVDSLMWGSKFVFLKADGTVSQQNQTKFTDGSNYVKLRGRTSFINVGALQGFQRVKRVGVLGEFKGPHKLNMQFYYDYNDTYAHQATIDATAAIGSNKWGSGPTWGSDSTWGGLYTPYQFVGYLQQQLCQSLSIAFEDSQSSGYNEGYSISGLTLEVGTKRGLNKVNIGNRFG